MYQCTACGRPADLVTGCTYCGQPAPPLAVEIERLNRDIAEMSARDLAIQRERADLSAHMQAALHQRALLSGAQSARVRRTPRQRGAGLRVSTLLPSRAAGDGEPTDPLVAGAPEMGVSTDPAVAPEPQEGLRPEASSRSVQNILLGLGAMLLALAAAIFAAYFVGSLVPIARSAILVVACAGVLMVPPLVIRRGLTAT
ncbi:MAG TPA: permease, partial [Micromonosporaceae bacterium]|nr:permease [Micromonosporaceae bacterium]